MINSECQCSVTSMIITQVIDISLKRANGVKNGLFWQSQLTILERKDPSVLGFFAKVQFYSLTCLELTTKAIQALTFLFLASAQMTLFFTGHWVSFSQKTQTTEKSKGSALHHTKKVFWLHTCEPRHLS